MTHKLLIFIGSIFVLSFVSCEGNYVPKPRGFQRIELPAREYKEFNPDCQYRFKIPVYADAIKDDHPLAEPCWFNILYKPFNATLHLSYKPLHGKKDLFKMIEDSRTLVYKHTIKADEIYETVIANDYLSGMLYELSGSTATNFQFYVTDSSSNYIRGALYFNEKTNLDSVSPVLNFIKEDVIAMIKSLRWQRKQH